MELQAEIAALAPRLGVRLDDYQCAQLAAYAGLVDKWGRITNLTGARNPGQFVREHVADCLAVAPHLAPGALLDVGSGAGLPGIVLAICAPQRAITLLEPRARRARFLTQATIELGLAGVEVVCARIEAYRAARPLRYVIARAYASLGRLVRDCDALREPGLEIVAMCGEVDPAAVADAAAHCGGARVVPLAVPGRRTRHLVVCDGAPRSGRAAGSQTVVP